LQIEGALEFFAFFGGIKWPVEIDFFDDLDEVVLHQVLPNVETFARAVSPSYLLEEPYRKLLIATARGDGKLLNVFRRARINEATGGELLSELVDLGILLLEPSREAPLREHPRQKVKKHLRHYRIQSKVRFRAPFLRFWFGFIEPYRRDIAQGKTGAFLENFRQHQDRCASLSFEQLSAELLSDYFAQDDPLLSEGSYWDRHSEFDLLGVSRSGKVILGECKYKGRKICKSELNKLKEKALHSGISVDIYALFSKNGFSNELLQSKDEKLLLFEVEDFRQLLG
jgi:AAA+ ATPase superfamily predicted ATPase